MKSVKRRNDKSVKQGNCIYFRWWIPVFVAITVCAMTANASAGLGAGVRGGVQFRGETIGIVGGHIESAIFPMVRLRPNLEFGKKGNRTIINPNLDISININPSGIGPSPYVGGGVGIQTTRKTVGTSTTTENKGSVDVHVGVQAPLAPMVRLFVEGKGVFLKGSRTGRLLLGITISL